MSLRTETAEVSIPGRLRAGLGWEYVDVPEAATGVTITALEEVRVLELTGFAPWTGPRLAGGDGAFVVQTAAFCGPPIAP